MNQAGFAAILPLAWLSSSAVVLMVVIAIRRMHHASAALCLAGLAGAFLLLPDLSSGAVRVTRLILMDRPAVLFAGIILLSGMATVLLAHGFLDSYTGNREEFYLLLLLAVLGAAVLASASHFASLFLGLEILSVSLYTLVAYPRLNNGHTEAGIKYLILAAAASAFLLFGMALFFAGSGSMEVGRMGEVLAAARGQETHALLLAGTAMMLVAVGFKLALAPFHGWSPDVVQGSPAPVAGFLSTVSKAGVVALLFRLFPPGQVPPGPAAALAAMAVASMATGNLLALGQDNVKRILAYSSIAHLGYLLTAFLAGGGHAAVAVPFYLATYCVATLGAFGVMAVLSEPGREAETPEDFRGLFWRRPWLAGTFAAMLLSLAGLPLTAGFVGKFQLVLAGVGSGQWTLVLVLVITSAVGLYYYLRVVAALFERTSPARARPAAVPLAGAAALAILALALAWIGVLPARFLEIVRSLAG